MMIESKRLVLCALSGVLATMLATAPRVAAFSGGISSTSFSAAGGCNDCHAGGSVAAVTRTGPTSVDPDSTHEYTITVSKMGTQDKAGLNVASALGVLATGGAAS